MSLVRIFKGSDFEMLTVLETIINACIKNLAELITERPGWSGEFFPNLLTTVQGAFKQYLGIDNYKELRKATQQLYSIIEPAKVDASKFNAQVKSDFNGNKVKRDEYLKTLGFKDYFSGASKGVQGDLILLLLQFNKNITTEIEADITAKGMNPLLINRLKGYGDILNTANITQETAKLLMPEISLASVKALNGIYNQVIAVCKIARNFYKGNSAKQDQFSYSNVLTKFRGGVSSAGSEEEAPQTQPTAK